jgi:hypothetical protein
VTEAEEAMAKAKLAGTWTPPNRPASNPAPAGQPTPDLPIDAPLSEDNIVTGRLELTLKFSDLPKPMPVKSGMKIGIQTDSALVVATLPPKAWKKLEKAQAEWPQWVAALTGKLGTRAGPMARPWWCWSSRRCRCSRRRRSYPNPEARDLSDASTTHSGGPGRTGVCRQPPGR